MCLACRPHRVYHEQCYLQLQRELAEDAIGKRDGHSRRYEISDALKAKAKDEDTGAGGGRAGGPFSTCANETEGRCMLQLCEYTHARERPNLATIGYLAGCPGRGCKGRRAGNQQEIEAAELPHALRAFIELERDEAGTLDTETAIEGCLSNQLSHTNDTVWGGCRTKKNIKRMRGRTAGLATMRRTW